MTHYPGGALITLPATTATPATTAAQIITPAPVPDPVALLLADKRSPATRRAYAADLRDFFGEGTAPNDVGAFLALPAPAVALRLGAYKAAMLGRGLAEATVNRRLAAVRSLLQFSYRAGLSATDGRNLVDGEKVRSYRDTRGIDLKTMARLLALPASLHGADSLRGLRDSALLWLLCENALRRAEVCSLDVGDFDPEARRLMIRGKGRGTQREPITVSAGVSEAVAAYLAASGHGTAPAAPLFRNLDRRRANANHGVADGGLTPDGLHDLVGRYGRALGLGARLSPHKLRHSAITAALDLMKGDVRKVQRLSRHAKVETLMHYDDNRADVQGEVTGALSQHLNRLGGKIKRGA